MEDEEVSAVEDLMREHGLLNRVLLIYEELIRRMKNNISFNPHIIYYSALIIREFVEDYHEKTEEKYVFPLLQHSHNHIIDQLLKQHTLGRFLTSRIMNNSENRIMKNSEKEQLICYMHLFVKMYRQHEVIEDTVIFPAFKKLLTKEQYDYYGELFEQEEKQIIGENGFKKYLDVIILIEKYLGINDLSKITSEIELILKKIQPDPISLQQVLWPNLE